MSVLIGHACILYNATILDYANDTVETKLPGRAVLFWMKTGVFFSGRVPDYDRSKKVDTQLTLMQLETWMGIAVYGDSRDRERERVRSSLILSILSRLYLVT